MHLGGHATHTYTHAHTHTHGFSRTILSHTHTYTPLLRTTVRIHSFHAPPFDIHFVGDADPSPSLFSFLHFPSHLYLSFAAYWKKLTCGVIRSFNYSEFLIIKKSAGSWHWPHCHKNEMCRFRLFPAVYRCSILQTVRENAGDNTLIPAGHVLVCISLASR